MCRREFLKALALAALTSITAPSFSRLAAQERSNVKITDVKVMRVRMKGHVMPLVKIETDVGVHGIGECHHDVTSLGAKDAVLNALREMLIGQYPFDIDKLTTQMMWRVSHLGGTHGIAVHGVTGCEVALCDLTGKLLEMPVRKILAAELLRTRSGPIGPVNLATCWIRHRAAKCFRLSSRPGG